MTDLRNLLDTAAGDEPAVTDQHLAADLQRGRTSLRRRRFSGVVSGVAAVSLVVGGAWTLLPRMGDGTTEAPQVAAGPTTPPSPPARTRVKGTATAPPPGLPLPKAANRPVALVPDGVTRPGTTLVCDLMPKGWTVKAWSMPENPDELVISDPALDATKYVEGSTWIRVRHARFYPDAKGRLVVPEKYSKSWDEFPHVKAGKREAIVAPYKSPASNGLLDVHVKVSATKLVQVMNGAPSLGWDRATLLRFAGSCRDEG